MSSPQIQTHRNWQYTTFEGKDWKRRVGATEWKRADSPPPTESPPMELKLVRQEQSPGEPDHWSLFLAREGQPGTLFQVKGDALAMQHAHDNDTNVLSSESYKDSYIIARPTEDQSERIQYWATHEAAPGAPNQAAVTENCQGWAIRVIRRLVTEGIIQGKWVNTAVSLQQPVK
ncbi:MAG: hypothetical protein Q9163_000333 [Psora crenata]